MVQKLARWEMVICWREHAGHGTCQCTADVLLPPSLSLQYKTLFSGDRLDLLCCEVITGCGEYLASSCKGKEVLCIYVALLNSWKDCDPWWLCRYMDSEWVPLAVNQNKGRNWQIGRLLRNNNTPLSKLDTCNWNRRNRMA